MVLQFAKRIPHSPVGKHVINYLWYPKKNTMNGGSLLRRLVTLSIFLVFLSGCVDRDVKEEAEVKGQEQEQVQEVQEVQEVPVTQVRVKVTEITNDQPLTGQQVKLVWSDEERKEQVLNTDDQGEVEFIDIPVGVDATLSVENAIFEVKRTITVQEDLEDFLISTLEPQQPISVPVVMQEPALPTGCEITSLTAIFNYFGESITKEEMASDYLKQIPLWVEGDRVVGVDPQEAFIGTPTSPRGVYVFPQGIIDSAQKYAESIDEEYLTEDLSGLGPEEIAEYVNSGIPVLMWITIDLEPPTTKNGWWIDGTDEYHNMFQNQHAVVLTSVEDTTITIMDPLKGNVTHDKTEFFSSYEQLGSMAMTVYPKLSDAE